MRGWEHKQEVDETALNVPRARQRLQKITLKNKTKKHQIFRHPHEVLKKSHTMQVKDPPTARDWFLFPAATAFLHFHTFLETFFFSTQEKKNPHQKKKKKEEVKSCTEKQNVSKQ